jgi:GTPase SAR1 family protein
MASPRFKLVLMGDGGVGAFHFCSAGLLITFIGSFTTFSHVLMSAGKSSFLKRLKTGEFQKHYKGICARARVYIHSFFELVFPPPIIPSAWCFSLHSLCLFFLHTSPAVTAGVDVVPLAFRTARGPIVAECWDTCGQRFGGLSDAYNRGAHAALIMFDVTSRITYRNVPEWHRNFARVCAGNVPIAIVGNQVDVGAEARQVFRHPDTQIATMNDGQKAQHGVGVVSLDSSRPLRGGGGGQCHIMSLSRSHHV